MASAVRTGRVLFSTMILARSEWATISWAVFSQYCRSEAMPAPWPKVLVGVLTETKMMSASRMPAAMSVEKNRLRPRASRTTSSSPGSKIGRRSVFQARMRSALTSTTVTLQSGHLAAMTAMVGPPT